jgi:pimeloyl-ACP methyl ester carboxylesterase
LGFAVLAYDKRGVGASSGDWRTSDFHALAGDALAGVRFLAGRPDIRRDRIGLWGISQAGWIEPIVAARAPKEIAFLIVHAGTGTTVAQQGILSMQYELRYTGVSEEQIQRATSYRLLADEVLRTGRGREELLAAYQRDKDVPGVAPPPTSDAWFPKFYRLLLDFDPVPVWQRVTCPVLLLFGELDGIVPPKESAPPIDRALKKAGNRDVTVKIFPGANHVLFAAKTGTRAEYARGDRFVPEYFNLMREWLHARIELPR